MTILRPCTGESSFAPYHFSIHIRLVIIAFIDVNTAGSMECMRAYSRLNRKGRKGSLRQKGHTD
jgi:hypothetical protein